MDATAILHAYQEVNTDPNPDVPPAGWAGWSTVLEKLGINDSSEERKFDVFLFITISDRQARDLACFNKLPSQEELNYRASLVKRLLEHQQASQRLLEQHKPAAITDAQVDELLGEFADARVGVGNPEQGARIFDEREEFIVRGKTVSSFKVGATAHDAQWMTWEHMCHRYGAAEAQTLVTEWDDELEEGEEAAAQHAPPLATQALGAQVKVEPAEHGRIQPAAGVGKVPSSAKKGADAHKPPAATPAGRSTQSKPGAAAEKAIPAKARTLLQKLGPEQQQGREQQAADADALQEEEEADAAGQPQRLHPLFAPIMSENDMADMECELPCWRNEQAMAVALGRKPAWAKLVYEQRIARARAEMQQAQQPAAPQAAAAQVPAAAAAAAAARSLRVRSTPASAARAAGGSRAAAAPATTPNAAGPSTAAAGLPDAMAMDGLGDELEAVARELRKTLGSGSAGRKRPTPSAAGSEDDEGPPVIPKKLNSRHCSLLAMGRAGGSRPAKAAKAGGKAGEGPVAAATAEAGANGGAPGSPSVSVRTSERRVLPQAFASHPHVTQVRPAGSPAKPPVTTLAAAADGTAAHATNPAPPAPSPMPAPEAGAGAGVPLVSGGRPQPAAAAAPATAAGAQDGAEGVPGGPGAAGGAQGTAAAAAPAAAVVPAHSKPRTRSAGQVDGAPSAQAVTERPLKRSLRGKQQASTSTQQGARQPEAAAQDAAAQGTQAVPETQLQGLTQQQDAQQQQQEGQEQQAAGPSGGEVGTAPPSPAPSRAERRNTRKSAAPKRAMTVNDAQLAALHEDHQPSSSKDGQPARPAGAMETAAPAAIQPTRMSTRASQKAAAASTAAPQATGTAPTAAEAAAGVAAAAAVSAAEGVAGGTEGAAAAEHADPPATRARGRRGKAQSSKVSQQGGVGHATAAAGTDGPSASVQGVPQAPLVQEPPQPGEAAALHPSASGSKGASRGRASSRSRVNANSRPGVSGSEGGTRTEGDTAHAEAAQAAQTAVSGPAASGATAASQPVQSSSQPRAAEGPALQQAPVDAGLAVPARSDAAPGPADADATGAGGSGADVAGVGASSPGPSARVTRAAAAAAATPQPLAYTTQESQFDASLLDLSRSHGYKCVADVAAALFTSLHKQLARTWTTPAFPLVEPMPEPAAIEAELQRVARARAAAAGGAGAGASGAADARADAAVAAGVDAGAGVEEGEGVPALAPESLLPMTQLPFITQPF